MKLQGISVSNHYTIIKREIQHKHKKQVTNVTHVTNV
jgi:hypothetical protein